jgi:hypothetical protein
MLEQTVGQRTLSVVDMCDNAEVANFLHWAAKIVGASRFQCGIRNDKGKGKDKGKFNRKCNYKFNRKGKLKLKLKRAMLLYP